MYHELTWDRIADRSHHQLVTLTQERELRSFLGRSCTAACGTERAHTVPWASANTLISAALVPFTVREFRVFEVVALKGLAPGIMIV